MFNDVKNFNFKFKVVVGILKVKCKREAKVTKMITNNEFK